jgi:hypothetical protein
MVRMSLVTARRMVFYEEVIVTRGDWPNTGKGFHVPAMAGNVLVAVGGLALGAGVAALPLYVPRVLAMLRQSPRLGTRRPPLALPPASGSSTRAS